VLARLAKLWEAAEAKPGARLSQAWLGKAADVATSTVNDWAKGKALPRDAAVIDALAQVLARRAGQGAPALQVWEQLVAADVARRPAESAPGQLVSGLADPFALEVHKPVEADSGVTVLPALPPYARRAHDEALAAVVAAAAGGQSRLAVLVGEPSTGKTRACWEAVTAPGALPAGWRLWHPYDPTQPEALLGGLPAVAPRTVVWLNEAQLYLLEAPVHAAERAASALRTLLADSGRRPVLVLATLWPRYWDALTREPGTRQSRSPSWPRGPLPALPSTARMQWPSCWAPCGSWARPGTSPSWPRAPPLAPASKTRLVWACCLTACGHWARMTRSASSWPAILPPPLPSTTRMAWSSCWTTCGR
jgi:hypothetical protein